SRHSLSGGNVQPLLVAQRYFVQTTPIASWLMRKLRKATSLNSQRNLGTWRTASSNPLIPQWRSFLADFVPLALRHLIRLARDAPARRPSISYPVSATRVTVDKHREELFGVQPIKDADHQSRILEVATATDQNSHPSCPRIRNISIKR